MKHRLVVNLYLSSASRCMVNVEILFCGLLNKFLSWRHSSLIVSELDSRLSSSGFSLGWGHCVAFFGKTLYMYSHSAGWDENEKMRLPFGQAVTRGY